MTNFNYTDMHNVFLLIINNLNDSLNEMKQLNDIFLN